MKIFVEMENVIYLSVKHTVILANFTSAAEYSRFKVEFIIWKMSFVPLIIASWAFNPVLWSCYPIYGESILPVRFTP